MVNTIQKFVTRSRYAVAGVLFALSIVMAGAATVSTPTTASANSCDPVNIVLCGLDGRSLNTAIDSFQADYNQNNINGHTDLKSTYRWAGATDASVAGMNTNNTKLGTLYRNGDIKVNGTLVGHDAWVSARFTEGAGFVEISPGVWVRKTTTSFAQPTHPVIVHMDSTGNADFAVMIGCGNAVKFTPTPQRHPELVCGGLTADMIGTSRSFNFHATAQAKDTTITKYVFDFGDSTSKTVATSAKATSATHTFTKSDTTYHARVTVFSKDFPNGKTGSNCVATVKTPAKPTTPPTPTPPVTPTTPTPTTPAGTVEAASTLANTGPAGVFGLFGGTTALGALVHRLILRRKLGL